MGHSRRDTPELTPRQREVLELVARGHTNREIAEALGISANGVKWHVGELLTKFEAATREELAERWGRERSPWTRTGRWLATLGSASLGKGAGLAGAVALVAVGAVVAVTMMAKGDGEVPASQPTSDFTPGTGTPQALPTASRLPPLTQPELRLVGEGNSLRMWAAPGADLTPSVGVLDGDLGGNILLVDPSTGLVLGKVEVGYGPWAVFRRPAGELLIAHRERLGTDPLGQTTLAVLDLTTLRVKREIPLPQRTFYTGYVPGMRLTDDGRYLFYDAVYQPPSGCTAEDERTRPPGTEGHCDHIFVGTIDLSAPSPAAALVEVPLVNCNYWVARVVHGSTGYVVCVEGTTYAVDAANPTTIQKVTDAAMRPNESDPVLRENLARAVWFVREPGGTSGILFSSGNFLLLPAGEPERRVSALPPSGSLGFDVPWVIGDRIYLPYRGRTSGQNLSGISIFDWRRGAIVRDVPFDPAVSVSLVDARTVLALLEDGSLQRIDLQTGQRVVLGGRLPLPGAYGYFLP